MKIYAFIDSQNLNLAIRSAGRQLDIEYNNFDKAIIVSGDGDFYCLIKYLREKNKLLKIGIPNYYKYSTLLKRFIPYCFYINNLRHKLEYKKERH